MTALQARLLAARAVRAAQDQADFARRLREDVQIPQQRVASEPPALRAVPAPSA